MPPAMAEKLPGSLSEAVGLTRARHPKVLEAQADVDAANAEAKKAKGDFAPTVGLELSGRIGDDIDAFRGERSEEHTSELQSLMRIPSAVFCLKKKKTITNNILHTKTTVNLTQASQVN